MSYQQQGNMSGPVTFSADFLGSGVTPKAHVKGAIRDFNSSFTGPNSVAMSSCFQLVQVMQAEGQLYLDKGQFNLAEKCYSFALDALKVTKQRRGVDVLPGEDLFQFWSNRSYALFRQGKYQDALHDAVQSIQMDKNNVKGYWRASQACKAVSNYTEAALFLLRFMNRQEITNEEFSNLITELASIVKHIKGEEQWKICRELEPSMLFTNALHVWTRIIKKLTEVDFDFDAVGILTIGMCSNDQVPQTVLHKMADIPGLSYSFVNLGRMLSVLRNKEGTKAWHLKLAEFLVKRKADISTLKHFFPKPLLVIMTTLSVEGDVPSFLSLGWDKVLPEDYDEPDLYGNTPAHALAKAEKFSMRKREVICNDLLSHGCLTTEKDKEGKLPHQCVSADVSVHKWLKTAAQKPGEGILRRLKQIRENGNTALKERKFAQALQLYEKALNITKKFQEPLTEAAVLHSNKAAVYLQMEKYSQAVIEADESLKADPSFCKALFRKGQALTKLKEYENAFLAFMMGNNKADEDSFRFKFVSEAASLLSKLPGNVRNSLIMANKTVFESCWAKLLEYLTTNKHWAVVHIFIAGPPFEDNHGIMGTYDASTARLSTIFDAIDDNKENAAVVVCGLLMLGAPAESLTTSEKETHFHAAVRFCILTNDDRVLKWILEMDSYGQMKTSFDHEGRTPLHILCLEAQKRFVHDSLSIAMARMLFEKGIDVKAKDKYQRQAVDYAVAGTELKKYIQQISAPKPKPTNGPKPTSGNTQGPKSSKPKESEGPKSSSSKAKPEPWEDLKQKGNQAFKEQDFSTAVHLYSDAITCLEREVTKQQVLHGHLRDADSHNLAVLYGNRAECWFKLKDMKMYLEDAKKNVDYDATWYKGHLRVGRAFREKGRQQNAARAFVNAFKALTPKDGEPAKLIVLQELVEIAYQLKDSQETFMKDLSSISAETWGPLSYDFVKNEKWDVAEFVFRNVNAPPKRCHWVDLGVFCRKELLGDQRWVCSFLLWLIDSGADCSTLKFHPGDTYFHAVISIFVMTGSPPVVRQKNTNIDSDATILLNYMMDKVVLPRKDTNIRDDKGNTVLHHLATLKGPDRTRDFLSHYLLEKGVDVMAENGEKKKAIDLVTQYDVIKAAIMDFMDRDIAIHSLKEQNKQKNGEKKSKQEKKKESQPGSKAASQKPPPPPPCDDCKKKIEAADKAYKEEKYSDVYLNLVNVINVRHNTDPRHKDLRDYCINRIATLLSYDVTPDIPVSLTKVNAEGCREILDILAKSGKWRQLEMLVTKFRQNKGPNSLSNFAKSMSVVDLVQEPSLCNMETTRIDLINLLINNGAGLETRTSAPALETAVKNSEWQVVSKLLDLKANPKGITMTEGDTPLHAALQLALTIQPGNFSLLEKLKTIYDSDKNAYPDLSLSCQDVNGNTLLHIAVKRKFSQHSLRAVELLCKWGVPADLANFEGLLPIQYLTSANDRRAQYLRTSKGGTSKIQPSSVKSKTVEGKTEPSPSSVQQTEYGGAKPKTSQFSEGYTPTSSVQRNRDNALNILIAMSDASYDYLNTDNDEDTEEEEEEEEDEEAQESEEEEEDDASTKESTEIETEAEVMTYEEDTEAVSSSSSSEEINIDIKAFDNLTWDVECTEEVWNILRTKKEKKSTKGGGEDDKDEKVMRKDRMQDDMKQVVVKKIQQLASGDWRNHLVRRVKGVPDSLQLYRITLPQGACVIWELAVAFSPRRSETAENILAAEDAENTSAGSAVKGGRIYSELIRVWSIVLKYTDYKRAVKKIVSSHHRGEDCIIQKNLKGLSSNQFSGSSSSTRVPVLYVESDLDPAVTKEIEQGFQKRLYPPASSRKSEFHILKFYSFSSSLVAAVLSHTDTKIDFPFRVTDIEHAIIHLDSKSPILLLGRSGTGKTTCCLYRLWSVFLSYWEQATRSQAALLPRWDQPPQLDEGDDEDNEDEGNNETSAKARAKSEERQAESSKKKEKTVDLMDISDEENSDDSDGTHSTDEEEEEEEEDDYQQYDHLHQLFVTKNPVLCSEVEKNFLKLRHAADVMETHNTTPKEPIPNTLQDVEELSYPLFLTSRQLLLMLDASVDGEPFFPRDEDLGLKVSIPGWGTQEDIFNIIPLEHESDEEDDDEDTGGVKKVKRMHSAAGKQKQEADLRRECTYDVFAYEVWPKIAKKAQISCHPSLVWTEIMSFIKGSYEALHSEKGYLEKNQYLDLGKKRAPNFSGDRTQVYDAFQRYNNYRQQHFLFDEADLVFKIYCRLRTMSFHPWVLHEIYVDETQDFTQAELALLVSLCHDPNKMFLTGDTAQSIMRGISFRFSDLRSLFHYAKISAKSSERYLSAIKVPQKVHQLTHNYRSHTGILSLASAVLDILVELFPESFDRLKKDQGLFAGPKPVIIESSSPGDLALLLTGNKRKTSHIEFGAHQAILVVSEKAKADLPEELTTGIVLTIYESKGLEFDDILIYNFFKDSPAKKEWRVVTDFLMKLSRSEDKETDQDNLVEIDVDVLTQSSGTRPLQFDPNQHKILNSELKHLYTALTRARVNVWIFDEDDEKRGPMFQYFKARKLVTSMGSQESEDVMEGQMFTDKSSAKEWRHSGDNFMRQKLYNVAAKCYRKAEQFEKERLALAYQAALEASRMKTSVRAMREKYLQAGTQFVECGDVYRAALCFQNAREHQLAALAFEKNGQFEEASKQYSQAKKPSDASRCLEQAGMFGRAIRVLVDGELFDRAIDCLHRYEMTVEMLQKEKGQLPAILIENKPRDIDSEANLGYRSAEYHCEKGDNVKAVAAIHRVSDIDIQIDFLQKKGFWMEAAQILRKDGRTEEAARMMLKFGDTDKALEYSRAGFHKSLTAFIHLVLARKAENVDNFQLEDVKYHSTKALHMYLELDDFDGQAQAKLLLGKHTLDMKLIKEAHRDFGRVQPPNQLGKLESFHIRMTTMENISQLHDYHDVFDNVTHAMSVLQVLLKPRAEDRQRQQSYLTFFGLDLDVNRQEVTWYPLQQPLCKDILDSSLSSTEAEGKKAVMQESQAVRCLATHYVRRIKTWLGKVKEALDKMLPPLLLCRTYQEGFSCEPKCHRLHRPYESPKEEETASKLLNSLVLVDYHLQTGKENLGDFEDLQTELTSDEWEESKWDSVKEFLTFIFPTGPSALRSSSDHTHRLIGKLRNLKVTMTQVERYLRYLWDNPGRVGRGKSQNVMKERCKSTDWIVRACFFVSLLGFRNKLNVLEKVKELESWLYKTEKGWFEKIYKYALYAPVKSRDGGSMIEAIGSRFVESFQLLIGQKSDPYEAIFAFTKMISPLGWRNNVSLMPKMNHLVFWLEVYFCLTWFFIAKANQRFKDKTGFFLPDSFLTSLHLVNECIDSSSKGKSPTIQQLVINRDFPQDLNKPGNMILLRQNHLSNFLVGCNRHCKFSLIAYINDLCNQNPPNYLLAERIALLTAVLLLNIPGNFVHPDYELPIRREIFKLEVTQTMPPRLASFLSQLKRASNYRDVGVATAAFLHQQGCGVLNKCEWVGRQGCPMQWRELKSSEYSTMDFFDGDIEELARQSIEEAQRDKARPQEATSATDSEMDTEDLEQDREKMEAKKREMEEEDRKKWAAKKISNAWKWYKMMTTLKRKTYRGFEIEEMFRPYTVKDTHCGICDVEFSEEDWDADIVDETGDGKESSQRTKVAHEQSLSHREKLRDFISFKELYISQIYYHFDTVTRFQAKYQVTEDSEIYKDILLGVTQFLHALSEFNQALQEIFAKRSWSDRQTLMKVFNNLGARFKEQRPYIESEYNKSKAADQENSQEKLVQHQHEQRLKEGMVEDEVIIDPTDQPVNSRGYGQGRHQGDWHNRGNRYRQGNQNYGGGRGRGRRNRNREEFLRNLPPRLRRQDQQHD